MRSDDKFLIKAEARNVEINLSFRFESFENLCRLVSFFKARSRRFDVDKLKTVRLFVILSRKCFHLMSAVLGEDTERE
jgi:hypothetical protein